VAETIRLVFAKFRELGSARQVFLWLRSAGVNLPVVLRNLDVYKLTWKVPAYHTVIQILHNPLYAGAMPMVGGRSKPRLSTGMPARSAGSTSRATNGTSCCATAISGLHRLAGIRGRLGAVAGAAGASRFLMLLLLDDVRIAPGASSESAFDQQMIKVDQRRYRHARRADRRHAGAYDRIQHPRGDHRHHARHWLDVNDPDRQGAAHCNAIGHAARRAGASGNGSQLPARYGQNDWVFALNRKNPLFAGSDHGAENWALLASLIETCKLHNINPQAYLTDVLTKLVNNWPNRRLAKLTPWAWTAATF
jgi:hypothetical protein